MWRAQAYLAIRAVVGFAIATGLVVRLRRLARRPGGAVLLLVAQRRDRHRHLAGGYAAARRCCWCLPAPLGLRHHHAALAPFLPAPPRASRAACSSTRPIPSERAGGRRSSERRRLLRDARRRVRRRVRRAGGDLGAQRPRLLLAGLAAARVPALPGAHAWNAVRRREPGALAAPGAEPAPRRPDRSSAVVVLFLTGVWAATGARHVLAGVAAARPERRGGGPLGALYFSPPGPGGADAADRDAHHDPRGRRGSAGGRAAPHRARPARRRAGAAGGARHEHRDGRAEDGRATRRARASCSRRRAPAPARRSRSCATSRAGSTRRCWPTAGSRRRSTALADAQPAARARCTREIAAAARRRRWRAPPTSSWPRRWPTRASTRGREARGRSA